MLWAELGPCTLPPAGGRPQRPGWVGTSPHVPQTQSFMAGPPRVAVGLPGYTLGHTDVVSRGKQVLASAWASEAQYSGFALGLGL